MMNRSFRAPEMEVKEEQRNVKNMMIGNEEELELFVEIGKHENELTKLSVLHGSNDLLESKPGTPPVPKSVASEIDDDDMLNSDIDKNDYEWLLTPPGSPLSSSSEIGPLKTVTSQNGSTEAHPATLKSVLANSQLEPDSRSSFASSLGLNSSSVGALRPSSSGGRGSATSSPRTPTDSGGIPLPRSPRPATPNSGASPRSSKPVAPTTRSPVPKARSFTSATRSSTPSARSSTLASRSSAPRVRSSTPVSRSSSLSARSSIPAARSSNPSSRSSAPAARSSAPSSRSSTPAARSSTPSIRSSKPGTRSSSPSTRSTLAASSSAHSSRSSTPVPRSSIPSSRSSTPAARPIVPAARPIVPASRSTSRSATPTNRPSALSTVSSSGGPPSRSSSIASARSDSATRRKPVPPHASSAANARPSKPSEMVGLAIDAATNLRTAIPERPVSAFRSRPVAPHIRRSYESGSNGRLRQQSHSPMRGQHPNGNTYSSGGSVPAVRRPQSDDSDNVNPVLMGTKMVERVMNLRKLPPPKKDEEGPIYSAGKSCLSQDSLGFGRTLSKKSLDMAMRHMDIRRSMPGKLRSSMTNIPASSIYSVRSGPERSRPVGVSNSLHGISSNTSSEFSITINNNRLDASELEDDYWGSGGKFSLANQDHGIIDKRGEFSPVNLRGR